MNLTSDVTPAQALALYSELDQQPTWSPWLKSCNVIDKNTGLSTWTIGALGLFYTWKAVKSPICETSYQHSICWESIDGMYRSSHKFIHTHSHILFYTGLPNKGRAVFFIDHQSGENMMDLTVMYDLPGPAAYALEKLGPLGARFIENTLRGDLIRFNQRLQREATQSSIDDDSESKDTNNKDNDNEAQEASKQAIQVGMADIKGSDNGEL